MQKLNELTEIQKVRLADYRRDYFNYGVSTDRADRAKAEAAIMAMRAEIGVTIKPVFIWCASPATSLLALQYIKSPEWKKITDVLSREAGALLRKNGAAEPVVLSGGLGDSLWASLWASLRASLGDSLGASLGDSLWASLGASLRDSLGASLWASLGDSKNSKLTDEIGNAWFGQHEAYWVSYYLFARDILGVKYDDKRSRQLDMWRDLAQSCCWWWAYENYVVISERPTAVGMNAAERLHCATGPAIAFADGWNVWALNGVRMTEEHVMTPAEKLDPAAILKEVNVDVRRELIRKMGVEMMLSHLPHQVLDKEGDYELLKIDFPGLVQDTRFLKMLNPSIGVWHLEGVERVCNTVQQAINWRAGKFGKSRDWKPAQLT